MGWKTVFIPEGVGCFGTIENFCELAKLFFRPGYLAALLSVLFFLLYCLTVLGFRVYQVAVSYLITWWIVGYLFVLVLGFMLGFWVVYSAVNR